MASDDEQLGGYERIADFDPEWSRLEQSAIDHSAWAVLAGGSDYANFRMWRSGLGGAGAPHRAAATPLRARAINIVLRVAAAQSGAVEDLYSLEPGATMNIGEDRPGWRTGVRGRQDAIGNSGVGQVDALIDTYEQIQREASLLDPLPSQESAASSEAQAQPLYVSEAWIRSVHASATRTQLTYKVITPVGPQMHEMAHGEYKDEPNHVIIRDGSTHYYCEPRDVGYEMSRLIEQLNSEGFRLAPPILQAAYAHWAITHIHPFADGNGRVARALSSLYLLNWYRIPVLIFSDRKLPYFKALEEADEHRPQSFVQYLQGRSLVTSAWLDELERDFSNPPLAADVWKLGSLVKSLQGSDLENRDAAAVRVRDRLVLLTREAMDVELKDVPGEVSLLNLTHPHSGSYVSGFRDIDMKALDSDSYERAIPSDRDPYINRHGGLKLRFWIEVPARLEQIVMLEVVVSESSNRRLPIRVLATCGSAPSLSVQLLLEDCSPSLSEATELRLQSLVRRILATCMQQLQSEIEVLLDSHGKSGGSLELTEK